MGRGEELWVSVFDGHGGWQVAEYAAQHMVDFFFEYLEAQRGKSIESAFTSVFNRVDEEMAGALLPSFKMGFGNVARIGSCVVAAYINSEKIFVANAGDCRCVLAERVGNEQTFRVITNDHNAKLAPEIERLQAEHPEETLEQLVKCRRPNSCYVKGFLQPTRGLGDFYLKKAEFQGPKPTA